jgi:glucan phosphoethanolaminetransferase (alkaline phosphatase superfamily)
MEVERIGIIRIKKEHKSNEMLLAIIFCLPMFFSNISEILLAFGFSGIMSLNYILLYALTLIVLMRTFLRRPERTICVIISAGLLIVISCLLNNDVYAYIFNFGHFSIHEIFQSNIMMFITRCIFPIIVFAGELDICKQLNNLRKSYIR